MCFERNSERGDKEEVKDGTGKNDEMRRVAKRRVEQRNKRGEA